MQLDLLFWESNLRLRHTKSNTSAAFPSIRPMKYLMSCLLHEVWSFSSTETLQSRYSLNRLGKEKRLIKPLCTVGEINTYQHIIATLSVLFSAIESCLMSFFMHLLSPSWFLRKHFPRSMNSVGIGISFCTQINNNRSPTYLAYQFCTAVWRCSQPLWSIAGPLVWETVWDNLSRNFAHISARSSFLWEKKANGLERSDRASNRYLLAVFRYFLICTRDG